MVDSNEILQWVVIVSFVLCLFGPCLIKPLQNSEEFSNFYLLGNKLLFVASAIVLMAGIYLFTQWDWHLVSDQFSGFPQSKTGQSPRMQFGFWLSLLLPLAMIIIGGGQLLANKKPEKNADESE